MHDPELAPRDQMKIMHCRCSEDNDLQTPSDGVICGSSSCCKKTNSLYDEGWHAHMFDHCNPYSFYPRPPDTVMPVPLALKDSSDHSVSFMIVLGEERSLLSNFDVNTGSTRNVLNWISGDV